MSQILDYISLNKTKLLISHLRQAEFERNYDLTIKLFAGVWNIESVPDFSQFEIAERAELYQLSAEFLIEFGKAKNLYNWQERGKDALEQAIICFDILNQEARIFQCRMYVALAYNNEGRLKEFQILLEDADSYFSENKSHLVYLQIQIQFSHIEINSDQIQSALRRIDSIASAVKKSDDCKTKVLFYNQAGLVYRAAGRSADSILFFEKAFHYASLIPNEHYKAQIINCLANTYRIRGEFSAALVKINLAFKIVPYSSGLTAHFLDTKANILCDSGEFDEALDQINKSILLFLKGDDRAGLCEAYWTQIRIYFKLRFKDDASVTFAKLYNLAEHSLGEDAAKIYSQRYNERILINPEEGTFDEKVTHYMRSLIEEAVIISKGKIVESANYLGIKHATFSKMLRNEKFSDVRQIIKETFGIDRQERSDKRK